MPWRLFDRSNCLWRLVPSKSSANQSADSKIFFLILSLKNRKLCPDNMELSSKHAGWNAHSWDLFWPDSLNEKLSESACTFVSSCNGTNKFLPQCSKCWFDLQRCLKSNHLLHLRHTCQPLLHFKHWNDSLLLFCADMVASNSDMPLQPLHWIILNGNKLTIAFESFLKDISQSKSSQWFVSLTTQHKAKNQSPRQKWNNTCFV